MKLTEKGVLHISKLDIKMTSCHYLKKKKLIMREQLSVKY